MKVVNIFGLFRNNSTVLIPESDMWAWGFVSDFCFDSIVIGVNRARLFFCCDGEFSYWLELQ